MRTSSLTAIQPPSSALPPQLLRKIDQVCEDGRITPGELKEMKQLVHGLDLPQQEKDAFLKIVDKAKDFTNRGLFNDGKVDRKELARLQELAGHGALAATFFSAFKERVQIQDHPRASFDPTASQVRFGKPRAEAGQPQEEQSQALQTRIAQAAANLADNPYYQRYLHDKGAVLQTNDQGQLVPLKDGAPKYYCYGGVEATLKQVYGSDFRLPGKSAYMAGDLLASKRNPDGSPMFREQTLRTEAMTQGEIIAQLDRLPAGAVIVWNRSPDPNARGPLNEHGHITVALGNGREASDRITNGFVLGSWGARVFLPQAPAKPVP